MTLIKNTLLVVSLLVAGCSSEEAPGAGNPSVSTEPVEATIPLCVESASLSAEVSSRATSAVTSGSIGVFLAGTGYTPVNNRQYNYATPYWTPNGGNGSSIYLGGAVANVCAYHPWRSGLNNSAAIPLNSQVYNNVYDLSFATNRTVNGTSAGKTTTFAMTRAYARFKLLLKWANYPGTGTVSRVELKNLIQAATLNITSGAYSQSNGVASSTVATSKNVTLSSSGATWGEYLLVPCTPASTGMQIVVTVDGKTMTTTVPTSTYKPVKGEFKSITLTIQGTTLGAISVTTEDWPAATDGGSYVPTPSY